MSTVYEIDGERFSTLEEFFDEFSRQVIPGVNWGRNLDAFNDVLWGGFSTPERGFTLVWKNSDVSRDRLGHPETARHWRRVLAEKAHLSWSDQFRKKAEAAESGKGPSIFDLLVEIIESHGPGTMFGDESSEVQLVLA